MSRSGALYSAMKLTSLRSARSKQTEYQQVKTAAVQDTGSPGSEALPVAYFTKPGRFKRLFETYVYHSSLVKGFARQKPVFWTRFRSRSEMLSYRQAVVRHGHYTATGPVKSDARSGVTIADTDGQVLEAMIPVRDRCHCSVI